ncbi:type II toxin-antitoxin system Phd/YefM family antitoxin [Candidatus Palauibacter sp.]|uniref:type II toxin-antitoxin system Phd/YefM family antitoxin n=1 Tax=Candidatus Palauibacter sp. TaxID=3101350 RepID=UPI003B029639
MRTVNMHEAKTHLSRLVQAAVDGEPFVIARAGKPLVKVTSIEARGGAEGRRTGFMAGEISVPPDFDRMGRREIEALFEGDEVTLRDA